MYEWNKTQLIAITGMFTAIIFLLMFMGIGFLPLPFVRPTILHIPVIIGALLMGPKYGALLGFMFGLASMLFATYNPGATSFIFSPFINLPGTDNGSLLALLVAFVPRILVGIIPWYVFVGLRKLLPPKLAIANYAIAGIVGSLTNTLLVMHFIYVFFADSWNSALAAPAPIDAIYAAIWGLIAANGVPEAITAAVLVAAIVGTLVIVIEKTLNVLKR
ncbi:MAG: ECF transporter S component [Defluviitaleaceae bacterium]|nr:ECF transporter S component [Defluviitaleaceae bacterium]